MKQLLIELNFSTELKRFYNLLILYVGITIIAIVARFFIKHWGWSRISFDGVSRETKKYLNIFIQADGNQIEKIGTGRFISIIDKWLYQWMDVLFDLTFRWVLNIIMVAYAIYTIAVIDWRWWFFAFILMVISAFVASYANIWMTNKREYRRKEQNEANHQTVIALMSKNELLQNNGLSQIISKINIHLEKARNYHVTVNIGFLVIEEFPRFTFLILRVIVYIFIAKKIFFLEGGIIELSIFVTIMAVAEKSLNEFLHLLRDILREFSSISLLWSTFDSLTPIKWYDSGKVFQIHDKPLEIKNISYGYNETKVFEDFSLTIKRGKKTALVWASGGGKTTLMKLIAGYLHTESWHISVMGNRIDETALKSYYPHIGYLTQDPSVFDATIRENLVSAIAEKNADTQTEDAKEKDSVSQTKKKNTNLSSVSVTVTQDEMLERALKLAQCDFVFELEKWLDTEVWERGVRLSWWQKQRLAIAKIFLKNPEIILLDEPTSALDSFSEEKITVALDTLFEGRTVIIIAHRLQTVRKADDIIVIEWGEVVERGNHEKLVAKKGIYHKMLKLQSGF
jgi:ABC-type multidrug transport system fused ATPase/permease subunit